MARSERVDGVLGQHAFAQQLNALLHVLALLLFDGIDELANDINIAEFHGRSFLPCP